jgi:hypothetical protein
MTISEDFKKPVNVIFLLLAITGIGLSIFFYFNGRKTKSISYQINEPASLIYDSKNASSAIKVLERDSVLVKDNVYLLTGVIWNSGDIPIPIQEVRKKISLNLAYAKKILDFKIVKQTDRDVASFDLTKNNRNSLSLSWKYFDPKYGFRFQIIYTGKENPQFSLVGKILDVSEFKKEKIPEHNYLIIWSCIITMFISMIVVNIRKRGQYNSVKDFIIRVIFPITYIIAVIYIVYYYDNIIIPL